MMARGRDRLGRPVPLDDPSVDDHGVDVDLLRDAHSTLTVAQDLLDRGFPFAAHEVFEARWKQGPLDERELWQGLAQWCVALTHAERGNAVGAATLRERSLTHLRSPGAAEAAHTIGLTLDALAAWLAEPSSSVPRIGDA